jgi:queuine tRNA-ribosyltransferase
MPTRNARNGMLFTRNGVMNMRNEKWRSDLSPIDVDSDLLADRVYSKAYLAHLIRNKEMLGAQIATLHNLHFYLWLVKEARKHILAGTFTDWKNQLLPRLSQKL